jgi:hypothetical protein
MDSKCIYNIKNNILKLYLILGYYNVLKLYSIIKIIILLIITMFWRCKTEKMCNVRADLPTVESKLTTLSLQMYCGLHFQFRHSNKKYSTFIQ